MNTPRVKEILSWYGSDSPGTLTNLSRLLNHGKLAGKGRLVILPVDQGFEHGPARSFAVNPPAYDPRYHFQLAIDAGCNAYAAPLGFIEAAARDYAGEIPLILKINNHDVLHDEKDPLSSVTSGVEDALRLGCVAIGFTIYPGSAHCQEMYQQLRAAAEQAKKHGLVVVVWSYPRGSDLTKEGETAMDVCAVMLRAHRRAARRAHHQGQAAQRPSRTRGRAQGLRKGKSQHQHLDRSCQTRCAMHVQWAAHCYFLRRRGRYGR